MIEHETATSEEWRAARSELLEREKALTRRSDELAQERRELPWVQLEKEYSRDTDGGTKTLAELFDGRLQLLVYHFMFGPEYTAGCPLPGLEQTGLVVLPVGMAGASSTLTGARIGDPHARPGVRLQSRASTPAKACSTATTAKLAAAPAPAPRMALMTPVERRAAYPSAARTRRPRRFGRRR
jgi:hypothetical protein